MNQVLRTTILVILAALAAFSVIYLQHRFDDGDRKSALKIVDEYRAPATKLSVREVLLHRHPNAGVAFSATTESSCFQHIRVYAVVQEVDVATKESKSLSYEFVVDINTQHIAPGNTLGEQALAELDKPVSFSATRASTSASAFASASASASPSR